MIDKSPIKTTVDELSKLVNINNYIGDPIETEDKILIPVSKAGVGFGVGERGGENVITGSGGGASVEPVTMVVVTKGVEGIEGIRTLNLTKGTEMNKAVSDIGLIITDLVKDFLPSIIPGAEEYYDAEDIEYQEGEIYEEAQAEAQAQTVAEDVEEAAEEAQTVAEDIKEAAEEVSETAEEIKETAEDL